MTDVFENVSEWLTVPDVAELLDVPLGRVRRLIEDHHLISVKRDGVQYVPREIIVDKEKEIQKIDFLRSVTASTKKENRELKPEEVNKLFDLSKQHILRTRAFVCSAKFLDED